MPRWWRKAPRCADQCPGTRYGNQCCGAFGATEIVPGSTNDCGFGDIAVGPQGQVMVAYQNLFDSSGAATCYVSVDPDGLGPTPFNPRSWRRSMPLAATRSFRRRRMARASTRRRDWPGTPIRPASSTAGLIWCVWARERGCHRHGYILELFDRQRGGLERASTSQ